MKQNHVKELWKQGKPAVQGWCSTGNPYIAELMAHAGFDAVVIDWQHGVGVSQESVVACIQAIGSSAAVPMVRLPKNSPEYISYVLDAGAYGVIVPMVNSYAEAEAAGRSCRYAPRGCRSIAANRPTLTEPLEAYVQRANDDVLCLVMVETSTALQNVEEIAQAPEIDGLYIGPSDLSLDRGSASPIGPMTTGTSPRCSASLPRPRQTALWPAIMAPGRRYRQSLCRWARCCARSAMTCACSLRPPPMPWQRSVRR